MSATMNAKESYDIVVIGAGTAGSVLVNRLSECSGLSILVLDAGVNRNDDPNVYTPGLALNLLNQEGYSWPFWTEAEPGLGGRTIRQPRGRIFGGTSAINSFALIYPNRAGVDAWANLGNSGWTWNDLEPSFERFQTVGEPVKGLREDLNLAHDQETEKKTNGPLLASYPPALRPMQKAWVETWATLGLGNRSDPLKGDALGGHTSTCHISADRKERSHAGVAFLKPAMERANVTIIDQASVDSIVFSADSAPNAVATGVKYSKDGNACVVHATKEVIIAAGTFASPALLERSGFGNSQHLSGLGIPVIYHNAGVGENLQDHIKGGVSFEAADFVPKRSNMSEREARELFEKDRSGPLSESACWAFSYMPLLPLMSEENQSEFLRLLDRALATDPPSSEFETKRNDFVRAMLSSRKEAAATVFLARKPAYEVASAEIDPTSAREPTNWITLFAMLAHPLSRGSVHLSSSSPDVLPQVQCNYYTNPLDIEVHARVIKALEKIAATPPLSQWVKEGGKRLPDIGPDASLEDIKEALRKTATTNYHPVGTCSMMPEALGGVVESRLRVYGTKNLRVVDASVIPLIPRGNVITQVYAIAEKAADMIKEDLGV